MLCGCLAERLAGLVLTSGLFWGIDTDKTDGMLLATGYNGDGVTVGDSGAFELTAKADSRKDQDGYGGDKDFKSRASTTLLLQSYDLFDGHFMSVNGIFKWNHNFQ